MPWPGTVSVLILPPLHPASLIRSPPSAHCLIHMPVVKSLTCMIKRPHGGTQKNSLTSHILYCLNQNVKIKMALCVIYLVATHTLFSLTAG